MRADDEALYVFDYGPMQIHRLVLDAPDRARLETTFGLGQGQAPGELLNLNGIVTHAGHVYLLDAMARQLSRFTPQGYFVDRVDLPAQFFSMQNTSGSLMLLTPSDPPLRILDLETMTVEREFGQTLLPADGSPLAGGGTLVEGPDDTVIYVQARLGRFHYVRADGSVVRSVAMMDHAAYGASAFAPPNERTGPIESTSFLDRPSGTLYQHISYRRDGEWERSYLDAYDWRTGAYRHSFALPFLSLGMRVLDGRLYAMRDTSLVVFDLPEPS